MAIDNVRVRNRIILTLNVLDFVLAILQIQYNTIAGSYVVRFVQTYVSVTVLELNHLLTQTT